MLSGSSGEGVYYQKSDHPGVWTRFAIGLMDLVVVGFVSAIFSLFMFALLPERTAEAASGFALLFLAVVYFVVLKPTSVRTVGYRLFHVRVVNLRGDRPSIFQMVSRFAFMLLGPLNGPLDLLWVSSNKSKLAIRDLWSQTLVIRDNAEVVGRGKIVMRRYEIMALSFIFAEVLEGGPRAS